MAAGFAAAQDSNFTPQKQLIPSPDCLNGNPASTRVGPTVCTAADYENWIHDVTHWREERRIRIGYNGIRYTRPDLHWTQSSFIQPQTMVHDRVFFDPLEGGYIVSRYVDDLELQYGGIDSVLLWHSLGASNRRMNAGGRR